jgi:hypothetical protein
MKSYRVSVSVALLLVFLLTAAQAASAAEETVIGLWRYEEIVTVETPPPETEGPQADEPGVLLADLETMPLQLLDRVFGKLSYTAEFTDDRRFEIRIAVLGMRFFAQGEWSVGDGRMTLLYDGITGFEKLWWLGGFDHLTHCDAEHTLTETVAYEVSNGRLTFLSNGANIAFVR